MLATSLCTRPPCEQLYCSLSAAVLFESSLRGTDKRGPRASGVFLYRHQPSLKHMPGEEAARCEWLQSRRECTPLSFSCTWPLQLSEPVLCLSREVVARASLQAPAITRAARRVTHFRKAQQCSSRETSCHEPFLCRRDATTVTYTAGSLLPQAADSGFHDAARQVQGFSEGMPVYCSSQFSHRITSASFCQKRVASAPVALYVTSDFHAL